MRIIILFSGLVLPSISLQAAAFDSSYTSVDEKDCKTLQADNMGSVQTCPGFANIQVKVVEGDLRQSITFVREGDGDYPQDFPETVSPAMSELGPKIEWRHQKDEADIPLAAIVRLNVSENPENPQATASYLVVSKITDHTLCVVGKVEPQKEQNEKARVMAAQAADMPCIDSASKSDTQANHSRPEQSEQSLDDAEYKVYQGYAADWTKHFFSIPNSKNPIIDAPKADCSFKQEGSVWFLGGVYLGIYNTDGKRERTCSIPENTRIFMAGISSININSPGVCGEKARSYETLVQESMKAVDQVKDIWFEVNGERIDKSRIHKASSERFSIALPEENVFDVLCSVPAGDYEPAHTPGFYTLIDPLPPGEHTLRERSIYNDGTAHQVNYLLTVVPSLE